jgi:glycosyltransferase involved in cell wall biosynthesis
LVKQQYPDAEFVVLGGLDEGNPGGLKKAQLEALIKENIIIYPGHVNDVPRWIAEASVFVLPSYREGVPRSTQEAMAIGRAVITTDVPGCKETVEHGVNGFIVRGTGSGLETSVFLQDASDFEPQSVIIRDLIFPDLIII